MMFILTTTVVTRLFVEVTEANTGIIRKVVVFIAFISVSASPGVVDLGPLFHRRGYLIRTQKIMQVVIQELRIHLIVVLGV